MTSILVTEKRLLDESINNISVAKDIEDIIRGIKDNSFDKIIFCTELNGSEMHINITPEIKDEIITALNHIKYHCKSLAECKLGSAKDTVKHI